MRQDNRDETKAKNNSRTKDSHKNPNTSHTRKNRNKTHIPKNTNTVEAKKLKDLHKNRNRIGRASCRERV